MCLRCLVNLEISVYQRTLSVFCFTFQAKSSKRPRRLSSKRKIEKESLSSIQSDDSEPICKRKKIVQTQRTMSTSSSSNDSLQTKSCRVIDLTGDPIVDLTDSPDYENEDLVCLDNSLSSNSGLNGNLKKSSDDIKITRTEPPSHKGCVAIGPRMRQTLSVG